MRKLLHKVYNRVVIIALLVAIQIGLLVLELLRFTSDAVIISYGLRILSIVVVFFIIYKKNSKPAFKLAWVVPILMFPLLGGLMYVFLGNVLISFKMRKRLKNANEQLHVAMEQDETVLNEIKAEDPYIAQQFKYLKKYAPAKLYKNTSTRYFSEGKEYWESLLDDLKSAKQYIFIEYFIIGLGEMWDAVLDILKEKVSEGVTVKLIYDDFGSALGLPNRYYSQMNALGIECVAFNRLIPFVATIMNNRDHRKIVVIDGNIGYTGGINLSDEYINRVERFGYWKDAGIRLEGDAVWNMTALFMQMWNISKNSVEDYSAHMSEDNQTDLYNHSEGYVQPYGDSPLDNELVGKNVYLNMINNAKDYLWIYTPYLIVDDVITDALVLACKKGVDVRIVTPGIPDKKMVYYMTRSSYVSLLEAGAKIYEYTPGFIHAKCTLADGKLACIGTVNYDYRSLYHHFECGVLMYKTSCISALYEDMKKTFEISEEITPEYIKSRKFHINVLGPLLHLFAPLL